MAMSECHAAKTVGEIQHNTARRRKLAEPWELNEEVLDMGTCAGLHSDPAAPRGADGSEEHTMSTQPAAVGRRLFASRWFTLLAGTIFGICITQLFRVPEHAAPYVPKSVGSFLRDLTQRSGGHDSTGNIQHHASIPAWKAR
ncbi:hypothetical protein Bbelb_351920 [Branchiostoma belcheri]|nr:hypothetical protein Bbelb_351920 [Branchiostoma belcheri]